MYFHVFLLSEVSPSSHLPQRTIARLHVQWHLSAIAAAHRPSHRPTAWAAQADASSAWLRSRSEPRRDAEGSSGTANPSNRVYHGLSSLTLHETQAGELSFGSFVGILQA